MSLASFLNIWTSQAQVHVQHQISTQLQALRQTAALQVLPTGPPNNGGPISQLSPDDAARRRQGLTNYKNAQLKSGVGFGKMKLFDLFNCKVHSKFVIDTVLHGGVITRSVMFYFINRDLA